MRALTLSWISVILWNTLITTIPTPIDSLYLSIQNNNTNPPSISSFSPSTGTEPPLNATPTHKKGGGEKYQIPNTPLTLYINLGFACNETALRSSIIAARDHCQQQIETGSKGEQPPITDSFDFGYGIAIIIVSARPDFRLSWTFLDDILFGMWNYLVEEERYLEATFDVVDVAFGLLGRGQIEPAPPWMQTS